MKAPELLLLNRPLAEELGFEPATLETAEGTAWLAGNETPPGAEPGGSSHVTWSRTWCLT